MKSLLNLAMIASVVGMMFACTNDLAVTPAGEVGGGGVGQDTYILYKQTTVSGKNGNKKATVAYSVKRSSSTKTITCGTVRLVVTPPAGYPGGSFNVSGSNNVNDGTAIFDAKVAGLYTFVIYFTASNVAGCNLNDSNTLSQNLSYTVQ
jgi:hypothetical protein